MRTTGPLSNFHFFSHYFVPWIIRIIGYQKNIGPHPSPLPTPNFWIGIKVKHGHFLIK